MKEKILEILKERDDYVSGEYLSDILGVSRTTIWKHINNLKDEGYKLDSITRKGYKLIYSPDILTYNEIKDYLTTALIGRNLIHYEDIESTNMEAKKIAQEVEEGTIIVSEGQSLGRGRMGRDWISPKYKGIWLSIIIKPDIEPTDAGKITLIASAAIVKALENMGIKAGIKWPNDILINRKKIAGILTEMNCEINRVNYIVVGIGINVNMDRSNFSEDIINKATSLKIEENTLINRKKLLGYVLNEFEDLYFSYKKNGDIGNIIDINKNHLVFIGEKVKILRGDKEILAVAKDINPEGQLVIQYEDGGLDSIFSGEVSIRGLDGYI